MIFCEFNYCIYNKKSQCQLKTISISPLGICEDCIVPNFSDEIVSKYKKEALEKLEIQTIKIKDNNSK